MRVLKFLCWCAKIGAEEVPKFVTFEGALRLKIVGTVPLGVVQGEIISGRQCIDRRSMFSGAIMA